jgi:hypothetical protein
LERINDLLVRSGFEVVRDIGVKRLIATIIQGLP